MFLNSYHSCWSVSVFLSWNWRFIFTLAHSFALLQLLDVSALVKMSLFCFFVLFCFAVKNFDSFQTTACAVVQLRTMTKS